MQTSSPLLEGDYVETGEGIIFAVKGHQYFSDRVVAIPRYLRTKDGVQMLRHISDSYSTLRRLFPEYIMFERQIMQTVCTVPLSRISKIHSAREGMLLIDSRSDPLSKLTKEFAKTIVKDAGIPEENLGVSGSVLLNLHKSGSDIDLVIYGVETSMEAYQALRNMRARGGTSAVAAEEITHVTERRTDTMVSEHHWRSHESRKLLTGSYRGFHYTMKLVKKQHEVSYTFSHVLRVLGQVTITGKVASDYDSIFTPNQYLVSTRDLPSAESEKGWNVSVLSFRSRFAEQAVVGEPVRCRGRLELIDTAQEESYRLLIGNSEEDYILSDKA